MPDHIYYAPDEIAAHQMAIARGWQVAERQDGNNPHRTMWFAADAEGLAELSDRTTAYPPTSDLPGLTRRVRLAELEATAAALQETRDKAARELQAVEVEMVLVCGSVGVTADTPAGQIREAHALVGARLSAPDGQEHDPVDVVLSMADIQGLEPDVLRMGEDIARQGTLVDVHLVTPEAPYYLASSTLRHRLLRQWPCGGCKGWGFHKVGCSSHGRR